MTKILIVGAGTFGLSTAASLISRRIYNVEDILIIDRFPPGQNIDAASYDLNKIVRMDYGDHLYAELGKRAIEIWRGQVPPCMDSKHAKELSECYHNVGLALVGQVGHEFVTNSLHNARMLKMPDLRELPDNAAIRDVLGVSEDSVHGHIQRTGYFNPNAGWADSALAIKTYAKYLQSIGVKFVQATVESLLTREDKYIGVKTTDGKEILADLTILASGAWTDSIVDTQGQLLATAQVLGVYNNKKEYSKRPVIFDLSDGFYVFPAKDTGELKCSIDGSGYSRATELKGRKVSVPITNLQPDTHPTIALPRPSMEGLRAGLSRFVSIDLAKEPFDKTRLCWYTDTVDTDFLVTPLPNVKGTKADAKSGAFLATGGSGHGFKFLPVIGDAIVDVMLYHQGVSELSNSSNPVAVSDLAQRWRWRPDIVASLIKQGKIGADGFVTGVDHGRGRIGGRGIMGEVDMVSPEGVKVNGA